MSPAHEHWSRNGDGGVGSNQDTHNQRKREASQHLAAEQLVKVLAIMDAQGTLGVDLVDDTLDNPRT